MYVDYFPLRVGGATRQNCRSAIHQPDWVKDETYEFLANSFLYKKQESAVVLIDWLPDELWSKVLSEFGVSTQDLIFKIAKKHMSDSGLWRHDFWKGRSKVSLVSRVLFFRDWTMISPHYHCFTFSAPWFLVFLERSPWHCHLLSCDTGALFNPCLGGHRMLTWPGFCTVSIEAINQSRRLA